MKDDVLFFETGMAIWLFIVAACVVAIGGGGAIYAQLRAEPPAGMIKTKAPVEVSAGMIKTKAPVVSARVNDPAALKVIGEGVRPMAERLRALDVAIVALQRDYAALANVPADDPGVLIDDGRDNEGISRLTGADVAAFMKTLESVHKVLSEDGVADVVNKPCVRALSVTQ